MPRVSDRHLRQLRPYLVGEAAKSNGEWDMFCPLHEDTKRSASLNVLTGEWYCFAGCGGGGIIDLIRARSRWVTPGEAAQNGSAVSRSSSDAPQEVITEGKIKGWHSALLSEDAILDYLITERGIHTKTVVDFELGWDADKNVYTIPVRGPEGEVWNVRRYKPHATGRTKIWSVRGMRVCELYPIDQLSSERIIITEGEWDTLLTIQHGYAAITRTAGASTWQGRWNESFKGKTVYLAQDCDREGQTANRRIARALHKVADVRVLQLPYEITPKHGKDLGDFWMEHDNADFESMLAEAKPWKTRDPSEPEIITVLDSFDAQRVGDPVKMQVTIKGRKDPGYSVPRKAKLECTRDRGPICDICPMKAMGGEAEHEIAPTNPIILGLLDATSLQLHTAIAGDYGVPGAKCAKLTIEIEEHQAVEQLFARPSIDHADGTQARDYKNVKLTSVGRHDTAANSTVVVTGALYPNPRDQRNEFLAWNVERQETSVDRFAMTPEAIKLMKRFQPTKRQRPLQKLGQINRELASHVTRIVGRPELHALMDLTYHSVLAWKFGGQIVHRGWLESLVVGDTRTGKSEAAERLIRHFGAGEIVGGEAATLAGLVGGMQQIGGKDWAVTWGVIPINDRRLVVIDELSGLHPDDIAKMSDVRASGMARLTKILQEVTFARTRLIWLGNPRHGGMDQFTYGVDAIRPLIGNPEDIARFDLAMAVATGDVAPEDYNRPIDVGELRYTSEACHTLLMWSWTRQPDQVVWTRGAEDRVYKLALEMGGRYVESPPLVQAANIRVKIARVAVALAARTFSTDDRYEKVLVSKEHVEDAVTFMDMLYALPSFGYAERSRERLLDIAEAEENTDDIRRYLLERRGLAKMLRNTGRFRRQDLEEVLNVDRDSANAIINKLYSARMIRKDGGPDNIVEPMLHSLLREVRW
jgi:5S rRNA maturation endonuclease (ribonuclease M5)